MAMPVPWKAFAPARISAINAASAPHIATRSFSAIPHLSAARQGVNKDKEKLAKEKARRKKRKHPNYTQYDLKEMEQFALCDAMRYIKAFEVGRDPRIPKYDLAIKLKTARDGPVIRNQLRLPHAVKTDIKVAVICPPDHKAAKEAKAAGATYVGEEVIFEKIKQGNIDFERCVAHPLSLPRLQKEGLGRILGPKGLMPSVKLGTVAEKLGPLIQNMMGGSMFRERQGVIRVVIGQLAFTPEQLRDNVKAMLSAIKGEAIKIGDQFPKEVAEVVLSSTNSPGFSLTGEFKSAHSPPSAILSAV